MYKVVINNEGTNTTIHSPDFNELKLADGVVKKEINMIDSFDFTFYLNNPGYGKIKPLKTLVSILNEKTKEIEFEGRVLGPSEDMDDSGLVSSSYQCEGELGYLHDAMQRHYEFRGTVRNALTVILSYFNSQVEPYKQFQVGNITVEDPNDFLYFYLSAEQDTFDAINDKLIDSLGGELQIRKVNGIRYLDYLKRVGEDTSTEIRLAKNLVSMSVEVDPTEIVTRLTPLGNRLENENEESSDVSEAKLTIESVNNGLPYIDRSDLIALFGIQGKSETWDDVTTASVLLTKGQQFMNNQKISHNQYQITAVDLSIIGLDIQSFKLGNGYPVINPIMSINENLRIVGKQLDINNPQGSGLTIGDKFKTRSQYQNESNKRSENIKQLQTTVENQSKSISVLNKSNREITEKYTAIQTSYNTVVNTLEIDSDTGTSLALFNLKKAIDDLGNDLPAYGPVTTTTDGLMISTDKIKLDNLKEYTEATHLQSGLFSASDKTKLDFVTVTSPIDLNDLMARLTALETPE